MVTLHFLSLASNEGKYHTGDESIVDRKAGNYWFFRLDPHKNTPEKIGVELAYSGYNVPFIATPQLSPDKKHVLLLTQATENLSMRKRLVEVTFNLKEGKIISNELNYSLKEGEMLPQVKAAFSYRSYSLVCL